MLRRRQLPIAPETKISSILTNRSFRNALRYGTGPLTIVQRVALFVFGTMLLCCGLLSVAAIFLIPSSMPMGVRLAPRFVYFVSTLIPMSVAILVAFGGIAIGCRTIRHVIWRSGFKVKEGK
jgi:hypothetical protein